MSTAIPLSVRQGSDAWLEMRKTGIGSSDAPIIAGEVGSVVELWAEKSGLIEPTPPDEATAEMFEWGHRLEPVIADWYAETQHRELRRVNRLLRHPEIPWAFASLDRVVQGEKRIVEIKTTRWGWEVGESVPGRVQAQVQHQLWVTGYDVADVAVLTGGSQPRVYEIARDDTFIDNLAFLETEFMGWVRHGRRPPMDGSENARRVLSKLYPRNDGTLIPAPLEVEQIALEWRSAKAAAKQAEDREATLANTIRALIGEADGFEGSFGRITYKRNADSTRIDWPTVANEVGLFDPELLAATIAAHTTTVEGPRVLRPSWKELSNGNRGSGTPDECR